MKTKRNLVIALGLIGQLGIASLSASADFGGYRFGSIAYSESTGRFGSSWGYANQVEANERALSMCHRGDCRTVVWFKNACGSLARARNGAIVWAWSSSLTDAKRLASNRCTREWGSCTLICSVCSAGNEP
jgi:serine/threonine-protein kinase